MHSKPNKWGSNFAGNKIIEFVHIYVYMGILRSSIFDCKYGRIARLLMMSAKTLNNQNDSISVAQLFNISILV